MKNIVTRYSNPPLTSSAIGPALSHDYMFRRLGQRHNEKSFLFASASDGIRALLSSLGTGGSVICSAYTCEKVIGAILASGNSIDLVDIDLCTASFKRENLVRAIAKKPLAIINTNLFRLDYDYNWILDLAINHNIPVIEDSALVNSPPKDHDDRYWARVASFGRGKPITLGGGGIVHCKMSAADSIQRECRRLAKSKTITSDQLRRSLFLMRRSVQTLSWLTSLVSPEESRIPPASFNYEKKILSEDAAAFILKRAALIDFARARENCANAVATYSQIFENTDILTGRKLKHFISTNTITPAIPILVRSRDRVRRQIRRIGIDCPKYWTYSIANILNVPGCPNAQAISKEILFLPVHSPICDSKASQVATIIKGNEPKFFCSFPEKIKA